MDISISLVPGLVAWAAASSPSSSATQRRSPLQPRSPARGDGGHIDLPRAREGGLGGGFFAIYISDPKGPEPTGDVVETPEQIQARLRPYSDPAYYPDPMPLDYAQAETLTLLGMLFKLERESNGEAKIVRTAAEVQQCLDDGTFAIN